MPFLTKMFEPEPQNDSAYVQPGDEEYDSADQGSAQSDSAEGNAGAEADAEATISVRTETSVTYETEDEAGGYTHASDVTLTVSADALLSAVTAGSFDSETESG